MKKLALSMIGLLAGGFAFQVAAQQTFHTNEFKIGMFGLNGGMFSKENVLGCDVPYATPFDANGYNSSILNVLAEDGFNICQTYEPNEWGTLNELKRELECAQANGFQIEVGAGHYYKPEVDASQNYLGYGFNTYDNCGNQVGDCESPFSQNYFRGHIDHFIDDVWSQSPYKDIIWGYHICEEASYYHCMHFATDCHGWNWCNTNYFKNVEIPPSNVDDAINYYKWRLNNYGITNHKMVVMEANHHKSIRSNTIDHEGIYNPQDFLQLLNKYDSRDVFFEGSYTQFSQNGWMNENYNDIYNSGPNNNWHYLGKYKSIEHAKTIAGNVQSVIASYVWDWPYTDPLNYYNPGNQSGLIYHYHSDPGTPNANWFWFQAYTSIIHGAKGIWFWDFGSWSPNDLANKVYMDNPANTNRFERARFPDYYKQYLGHLAKEMRFLVNNNLLSTDPATIVYEKKDYGDPYCIVPSVLGYLPIPWNSSENYGLRYTVRTNGNETIMIIANPLNIPVSVTLDFSSVSNTHIRYSTGVDVLFESNAYPVTSNQYKVSRNSSIDLTANTIGQQYYMSYFSGQKLNVDFGPLDVHIYKFVTNPPDHNNNWQLTWSNFGSNRINGWRVSPTDKFYTGDFDGDGTEELLCCQTGTGTWMTMLKYISGDWQWWWSNYGQPHVMSPYKYNLIVCDFNGDGKDDILGNDLNGWTTNFEYINGDFVWGWSDYGNAGHPIHPYKDYIVAGDFNHDGRDEIMCSDLPNGWTTMFRFDGIDWKWYWSNYGNIHAINPYRSALLPGDFDGDNKDDLLGFDGWATTFNWISNDWSWGWSTYGANNFSGWSYPLGAGDKVLCGNLDLDNMEELLFIQTGSSADWATSMDFANSKFNWDWSANSQYAVPFFDDWPLRSGNNTRYYLIAAEGEPEFLLAMREYVCGNYLVNMYRPFGTNFRLADKQKPESNELIIFPNPSNDFIYIKSNSVGAAQLKIMNMLGESVLIQNINLSDESESKIDINKLKDGFYIVEVAFPDHSMTKKLCVSR